jgi:hypothetical protein
MLKTILSASWRSLQVTWPEEFVMQSCAPKRNTQIKSAVPVVAMHPRKNVIHESQRYHRIGPFLFASSDAKLRSVHISTSQRRKVVAVKPSPIYRLADNEGTETTLRPSNDDRARVFAFVRLYVLIGCKTFHVRNRFTGYPSNRTHPTHSTTQWPLTQRKVMSQPSSKPTPRAVLA